MKHFVQKKIHDTFSVSCKTSDSILEFDSDEESQIRCLEASEIKSHMDFIDDSDIIVESDSDYKPSESDSESSEMDSLEHEDMDLT